MKILLIGYGKMGKEIESIAINRGHEIVGRLGKSNQGELSTFNNRNADVAIEFTEPDSAFENIKYCIANNIPILSGTTGWLANKGTIEKLTLENKSTFFYASNYSIGVNLFFQLNEYLAVKMNSQTDYNASIEEIHHTQKKDAPSGTAISIAEGIIKHTSYNDWVLGENQKDKIRIDAIRQDPVPGTHTVKYHSEIDDIEIKHTAHSRKGFALGAVLVAEWLQHKKGVLGMKEFLNDL